MNLLLGPFSLLTDRVLFLVVLSPVPHWLPPEALSVPSGL